MRKPISNRPTCDGRLEPVKLKCTSCDMGLERRFPISKLGLLPSNQQQFVEMNQLCKYNWSKNVPELYCVISRAVVLCEGNEITSNYLPALTSSQ